MSKFILLKNIQVENANAVSGFTWGFPAPTHFLGFVNALRLKLNSNLMDKSRYSNFSDILLKGCGIFSQAHQVHTYQPYTDDNKLYRDDIQFSQRRGTNYMLFQKSRSETPPVIEEAKMNFKVSLLIEYEGIVDNDIQFVKFIESCCYQMRLAGGSIFKVEDIKLYSIEGADKAILVNLKRQLLPGFALVDRSNYLKEHFNNISKKDKSKQLYDAWLDFCAVKQRVRPKTDLITKFINRYAKQNGRNDILDIWGEHLDSTYEEGRVPQELVKLFQSEKVNSQLADQWKNYLSPNKETPIDWEYQPKPFKGYLVPIMSGYKALSKLYDGRSEEVPKITSARDNITPVRFVEAIHSVAEWKSVHRLNELSDIIETLWYYHHEDGWYLCKNKMNSEEDQFIIEKNSDTSSSYEDECN